MGPRVGPVGGVRGGGPGPGGPGGKLGQTMRKLQAGMDVAKKLGKPIEEIIVTGVKQPKTFGRLLGPVGAGALLLGDIGAKLADQISQRKLDEAGRLATRTIPPKPDTPVATIQPEVIPEIVVTAKQPRPRPAIGLTGFVGGMLGLYSEPIGKLPVGARVSEPASPRIAPPKRPKKPTTIGVSADPLTRIPFDMVGSEPRFSRTREPAPIPRSRLLGIGTGQPKSIPGINAGLTGANVFALPLPQTQTRSAICAPCPRAKRKKRQRRTKCYRQLVKQGRYASRDKTSKWAQIDCDTGKTIKELI